MAGIIDATNSFGDPVESFDTLLAQYARVNRELAALATDPKVLAWRDAEQARANIEAAIKEEAHKRRASVAGHGYIVKVTPRTSVKWLADVLAEKAPWLVDAGCIARSVTYTADKKKLERLANDPGASDQLREMLTACRIEEALTPGVTIAIDAETLLAEVAS